MRANGTWERTGALWAACGLLVCACAGSGAAEARAARGEREKGEPVITVVYDNRSSSEALTPAWGFACLVEGLDKTILFDTGGDAETLLGNMSALGVSRHEIDVVVLSHDHADHTGGLIGLLDVHSQATVYLLDTFSSHLVGDARRSGATVVAVTEPLEVCAGATLTGPMVGSSGIPEQSLVLSSGDGAAVVTGCAHPGIVEIVERAGEVSGCDVLAALGGFHLFRTGENGIRRTAERLVDRGVRRAGPCHCSGDLGIEVFERVYGSDFLRVEAGTRLRLAELIQGDGSGAN